MERDIVHAIMRVPQGDKEFRNQQFQANTIDDSSLEISRATHPPPSLK